MYNLYQIKNKENNKVYYGISGEIEKRFRFHKNSLKRNDHNNKLLQEDYNKGYDFEYTILEENLSKEEAEEMEKYIIEKNKDIVYNFIYSGKPRIHSEETKLKISKNKKGKNMGINNHFFNKKHSKESINKMKESLSKIDRSGRNNSFARKVFYKGKEYGSVKEAMKASGLKRWTFYKLLKDDSNDDIRYLS